MTITPDVVERVLGAPGSGTRALLSSRRTPGEAPLETGVWYSGFTRVKTEAERRGLPFFALWTNGDQCSLCRNFTRNILSQKFLCVMRAANGLWWCGSGADADAEDGRDGAGFTWCQGPDRSVAYFPLFAVSYVSGGRTLLSRFGSGGDYDGGATVPDEGATRIGEVLAAMFRVVEQREQNDQREQPASVEQLPSAPAVAPLLRIRFNPRWDARQITRFQESMKGNGGYCLCQPRSPDTVCTCRSFMEQTEPGLCHCGAFEKFRA